MRKSTSPFVIALALLMYGVHAADNASPLSVYTTFYPLTHFSQVIGGARVHVVNPLPETEDGAFWVPPRDTIKKYHAADLIVMNGSNYEQGFGKVSLPESKVVNTTGFLKGNEVIFDDPITHAHGAAGTHTHQGIDGHTWVDPRTAQKQAHAIYDALCEKRPTYAAEFKTNLAKLDAQFDELDRLVQATLVPAAQGKQIFASHPAYNYLARAYKLNIKSFHIDPNETPAKDELERIGKFIQDHPGTVILWEDTPKPENKKLVNEKFKLTSVVFSPCESLDKEDAKSGRNFFDVMKRNIESLAAVLK